METMAKPGLFVTVLGPGEVELASVFSPMARYAGALPKESRAPKKTGAPLWAVFFSVHGPGPAGPVGGTSSG